MRVVETAVLNEDTEPSLSSAGPTCYIPFVCFTLEIHTTGPGNEQEEPMFISEVRRSGPTLNQPSQSP